MKFALISMLLTIGMMAPASAQFLLTADDPEPPKANAEIGQGAVLRGLDRVNGETLEVSLNNGGSAEVFGLFITLKECRFPVNNPTGDAYAFLTIQDGETGERFFEGWMFASAPALNALDHNRYDVWALRCKTS
ncbi:MAG: DUF2155 domain-containing protein [Paracoccaceae bacterium]|jgi:hypothetical protein